MFMNSFTMPEALVECMCVMARSRLLFSIHSSVRLRGLCRLCLIHTLRNRLISMRFGWHQWNTPKRANPRHRRSILSRWSHKWSTVCDRYTLPDQFDFGVSPFDRFFIQTKLIRSQCIPIHLQHSMRSPCRMCHSWCFQCIESTAK